MFPGGDDGKDVIIKASYGSVPSREVVSMDPRTCNPDLQHCCSCGTVLFSRCAFGSLLAQRQSFSHATRSYPDVLKGELVCFVPSSCVASPVRNMAVKFQGFNWRLHVIRPNGHLQQFGVPSPISVRGRFCRVAEMCRESGQSSGQL